jgi:hypothetical protein
MNEEVVASPKTVQSAPTAGENPVDPGNQRKRPAKEKHAKWKEWHDAGSTPGQIAKR